MAHSKKTVQQTDLSPAEIQAREAAGIALDLPLTEAEVQNREKEKAALSAQVTPPPEPEAPKPTGASAIIDRFVSKALAPTAEVLAAEKAEVDRLAQPLLTESVSIQTAFGRLKAKYIPLVDQFADVDWAALRRAAPTVLVPDAVDGHLVDIAKNAIWKLERAVADARLMLNSSFGDSAPTKDEVGTVSLQHATTILEQVAAGDCYYADKSLDGRSVRVLSATFNRAVIHMRWWLAKANLVLTGARDAVAKFEQAEREFTDVMSKLEPKDTVDPAQKKEYLPKLEPEKKYESTSYTNFEIRSNLRDEPVQSDVVITPLPGGARVQTKAGR